MEIRFSSQAMIMDGVKDFFEPQPRPTGHGAPKIYPLTTQKQALGKDGKEGNDKLLGNFRFHFEAYACRFDMELLWVLLARKSRTLESPSLVLAQILVYAALNKGGPAETAQVHAEESGAQLVKTPED